MFSHRVHIISVVFKKVTKIVQLKTEITTKGI